MDETKVATSTTESAEADPQPKLDSKKAAVLTPTQEELIVLVKHWTKQAIYDEWYPFAFRTCSSKDFWDRMDKWGRVYEIAEVLGDERTRRTVFETYQEQSQEYPRNPWIIFRYGNSDEEFEYEKVRVRTSQFDLEPVGTSDIALKVVERVFREAEPAEQESLLKEELQRYATKLKGYVEGCYHVVELFGIWFPATLKPLVLSTGVSDRDDNFFSNPYTPGKDFKPLTIEEGKKILAALEEKGEEALKSLTVGDQPPRDGRN